jgi:hypothetical protein
MVLKTRLFARAAACDRGFGASPRDRREIADIVDELKKLSPETVPTRGLYPYKFPLLEVLYGVFDLGIYFIHLTLECVSTDSL